MALSTSFTGGWYFFGQFFDHAVGWHDRPPVEKLPIARQQTRDELLRSRGQFGLNGSPESVIQQVASQMVNTDDEGELVDALRRALAERYIDWKPEYADMLLEAHGQLPAVLERQKAHEADAVSEWMQRRQRPRMGSAAPQVRDWMARRQRSLRKH